MSQITHPRLVSMWMTTLLVAWSLGVAHSAEFGNSLLAYAQYEQGLKELEAGEYKKAIDHFTRSIGEDSGSSIVFQQRGLAYHYLGEFDKAVSDFTAAIKLRPDSAEVYGQRAISRLFLNLDATAILDLAQCRKLDARVADRFDKLAAGARDLRTKSAQQSAASPKIEWQMHALFKAYNMALEQKKPMIVYVGQDACAFCKKLEDGPLSSEEVRKLSSKAVWAWINSADEDESAKVFFKGVNLDRVPALIVTVAAKEEITETGRIVGFFETDKFAAQLAKMLDEAIVRVK